jgi:hypothetical protein
VLSAAGLHVRAEARQVLLCKDGGEPLHTLVPGDVLSIHGQSGEVYPGSLPVYGIGK